VVIVPDLAVADVVAVQHPLAGIVRVKVDFENLRTRDAPDLEGMPV
jgi:hypothetical protein